MSSILRWAHRPFFPFILVLAALLAGCSRLGPPGPQQALVVGLPTDPLFQQAVAPNEAMNGFSRDLAELFAKALNVEVRYITAPDYPTLMTMVREQKVHFAATVPAQYGDPQLRYTPSLRESQQLIAKHVSALPAETPEKLAGREIAVMPGSPQERAIRALNLTPPPILITRPGEDEMALLEGLVRRRYEFAATDELHFAVASNYQPDLDIAQELPGKLAYVWAFAAENPPLLVQASRFIATAKQDGTLRRLDDRYFGHIRRLNTRDIEAFLENIRNRLSEFRQIFHEAQEITGIDWRLLAALAYQESKWDANATSPTGVRGMMMLTEDTADRLKVSNRLDARQSILAGSRYLAFLMDELPDDIKQPDRLWFALAAYNLGMGHFNGARHIAGSLKRDATLWVDMKQVLPLLARPEYYSRLKSGRARGGEAVILVENIRNYFDVLSRLEMLYTPPSMYEEKPVKKPPRKKTKSATGRGRA
jgi:membrane-bound lytic murein transglycosylase F